MVRVPVGTGTVYRIGSVTKQFTAAAVMDLVEHGRLGEATATSFSVEPSDISPLSSELSSFAGSTVRLRLAEVDNLSMSQAGVDAVAIRSRP